MTESPAATPGPWVSCPAPAAGAAACLSLSRINQLPKDRIFRSTRQVRQEGCPPTQCFPTWLVQRFARETKGTLGTKC